MNFNIVHAKLRPIESEMWMLDFLAFTCWDVHFWEDGQPS